MKAKKKMKPPHPIDEIIAKNITAFRLEFYPKPKKPLSQEALGRMMNCSGDYINKLEHGKGAGKKKIDQLSKVLGKPAWAFYMPFPYSERLARILKRLPNISPDLLKDFYGMWETVIGISEKSEERS